MLITKFNRMIRNKILWWIIAGVVIVTFTFSIGSQGTGCRGTSVESQRAEGRIFGENVSPEEFLKARYYELEFGTKTDRALTPEQDTKVRHDAWKRIAALRMARKMGIGVSDEELGTSISQDRRFAPDGVFVRERYEQAIRERLHVSVDVFEDYLRQNLVMRKVAREFMSMVWTLPDELNERISALTDSFTVQYAMVGTNLLPADVKVGQGDLEKYYNDHKDDLAIPLRVCVRYAVFAATNYLSEAKVSDEEIAAYYKDHPDDFTTQSTNETSLIQPLEQVRTNIEIRLKGEAALQLARDNAALFVNDLTPDRRGKALSWDAAAQKQGLAVQTSAYFAATEEVPGILADEKFNAAAFALEAGEPERYFSEPVEQGGLVYVLAAADSKPARMPTLDEVLDQVTRKATEQARRTAFTNKAEELKDTVRKSMDSGKSFTEAARALTLNVATTEPFTIFGSASSTNQAPYSNVIQPNVMELKQGELGGPIRTDEGELILWVSARKASEAGAMQLLGTRLAETLNGYRAGMVFEDWKEYVLATGKLEDFKRSTTIKESPDEVPAQEDPGM